VSFSDSGALKRRLIRSLPGNGFARVQGEEGAAGLGGAVGASMKMSILRQSFGAGKPRQLLLPARESTDAREHAGAQA
jgi:hypothetical protein